MSHPTDCPICAAIDYNLSNVENGRRLDVSEMTIRRHKAHKSLDDVDSFFTDIPNAIITSRGRSILTADGWEKITYSPAKAALLETLKYDDIERAIENYTFTPAPPSHRYGSFVLCLADYQVGKAGEAGGGTPELIARVLASLSKAVERVKEEKPCEIILLDLGDGIEGFSNTGSQAQTNDIDLTTQIRTFRRLMIEAIKMFAPLAPNVTYASVPSNHCQLRAPGGKDLASTPDNDFGLEVSYQLEDVLEGRENYSHVRFVRPTGQSEALTLQTVDGTFIGAVHGHQAKSPDKMGEWWKGQSHGRRDDLHKADILLYGHYHSMRVQQSGDSRWLLGAPTSDNGSQWFTNKTGEQSKSGMLAFTTNSGQWKDLEIL